MTKYDPPAAGFRVADANRHVSGARNNCAESTSPAIIASGEEQLLVAMERTKMSAAGIRVALIDCLRFSRDCLIRAFATFHPDLLIVPFSTVSEYKQAAPTDIDVILYYSHGEGSSEPIAIQQVKVLRQTFPGIPVVVLSDAQSALQPRDIRNALNNGAQGFIPTLTTEVPAALAAIRFVKDGGTFAPLNLLLAPREQAAAKAEASPANRLTPRQLVVLSHLRQGKANKIIAYELGMTESTVKVHIRNIMRKMGATNRTQAVYNSQQLGNLPHLGGVNE